MSAFLVSDKHISVIVNYGLGYDWVSSMIDAYIKKQPKDEQELLREAGEVQVLGDIFKKQNEKSLWARYGTGVGDESESFGHCFSGNVSLVQIIKACDCLEYQSNETGDYTQTDAFKILNAIRKEAIRALPGYSEADWDIE